MSWIRLGCSKFQPCTRTYSSDAVSVNSFKGLSHSLKRVGNRINGSFPKCVGLAVAINGPIICLSIAWLPRAYAKVRTTHRINSTELIRTFDRVKEEGGSASQILQYLKSEIPLLLAALVVACLVAYWNTQIPLLLGSLTTALNTLSNETTFDQFYELMRLPSLNLLKTYGFQALGTALYISMLSAAGENFASRVRLALFNSLVMKPMMFYDTHKVGELINRLTADVQEVKSAFKQCISLGFTGSCITLYYISPSLTAIIFVSSIVLTSAGTVLGMLLRSASRHAQNQIAVATSVAEEVLGNITTVKSFATEEEEVRRYSNSLDDASSAYSTLGVGIGVFASLTNLATNGLVLSTLFYGGSLLSAGAISAGDLMAFLVSCQMVQRSVANMSLLVGQAVKGGTAAARVAEYIDDDAERAPGLTPLNTKGNIALNNITFYYPSRPEVCVLDNVSLEVPAGQTVALCGASGAGKSTVAGLLERFYDVDSGSITLDGEDINTLDTRWLRGTALGYISQEPVLFATSIKENIRYGKPEASDAEIEEVAIASNAHSFILEFPEGYQTVLGERGATLSGGQKQRIAIARALLKDPKVLILDEATSALDAQSERVVSDALNKLCQGRTVLVIAHRLSTIRNADCIVVLEKGRIVEKGTHDELIKIGGVYNRLVQHQTFNNGESAESCTLDYAVQ